MEEDTATDPGGLEVHDITVRQVAGDPYVTLETPYITWRIKACCARLLGLAPGRDPFSTRSADEVQPLAGAASRSQYSCITSPGRWPPARSSRRRLTKWQTLRDGLIRCRVCGCTEREPCDPPCSWVEGEADLCSNCAAAAMVLVCWLEGAHRPSLAALHREVDRELGETVVHLKFERPVKVTFTKRAPA